MTTLDRKETFFTDGQLPFDLYEAKGACHEHFLHYHDCLELNYVLSGTGTNYIEDRKYRMRPGELYLINNQEHHIAVGEHQLRMMVLIFDPSFVWQNTPENYDYLRPFYHRENGWNNRVDTWGYEQRLLRLLTLLGEEKKNPGPQSLLFIRAYLLELLACICRWGKGEKMKAGEERDQRAYQRVRPAIDDIHQNFSQEITLERLARLSCMSRTYFCAYFKVATGMNLREYLRLVRINHARLLMATTDSPVTEICFQCGYSSLSSFNAAFRQLCAMSPTEYRRALAHGPQEQKS